MQKNVFSEEWYMMYLETCSIVIGTTENLLVEISGALGVKGSHFISQDIF